MCVSRSQPQYPSPLPHTHIRHQQSLQPLPKPQQANQQPLLIRPGNDIVSLSAPTDELFLPKVFAAAECE